MANGQLGSMMRFLRRVAGPTAGGETTDGQLLQDFVQQHEEAAFEALVRRHGAMVLGVCQRVLNDAHAAEDAFQATFLVLARKAPSIARRDSVGSWLYGVAYRTALKARTSAARRRDRERQARDMARSDPLAEVAWRDLRPLLDDELKRLPDKYRDPVVLCYLEGKTNEEAARLLGWTKGTVSGRLSRARDLLRSRLSRRGLAFSTGVLVAALSDNAAKASVTPALLESTVRAALCVAVHKTAVAGVVSAPVAALTEGVLRTMFWTPAIKILVAGLVLAGLTGTAGVSGVFHFPAQAGEQAEVKQSKPKAEGGKKAANDKDKIVGTWKVENFEEFGTTPDEQKKEAMALMRLVFTVDKLSFKVPGQDDVAEFTYKLDLEKDPRRIELTPTKGPEATKTLLGIYSLEGDNLKLCLSSKEGERPTEFKSEKETQTILVELKRAAANEKASKADEEKAAEAANRIKSSNNLKQIALAMLNYESAYTRYPPAASVNADGKLLLSWRVQILPFIEQETLYKEFHLDEPWDSEHNKTLIEKMPAIYAGPGVKTKEKGMTFYQVLAGAGTAFDDPKGNKIASITDGTSNTLLVVEAGEAVPWSKPVDLEYDAEKALPKLGGILKGGFNMALCDGSVLFVRKKFNEKMLRLFITRADGMVVDRNALSEEP
jgi:RNA polymerase sigma-70 factor (ECF subfamily)